MPPIMPTQSSHVAAPEALSQEELENQEFLAMHKRGDQKEIEGYYSKVLVEAAPLFDSYAGVMRPQFEFTTDPSIRTAAFYIDQNNQPRVKISYDYFNGKFLKVDPLNKYQAVHEYLHELTHFMDDSDFQRSLSNKCNELASVLVDKLVVKMKQKGVQLTNGKVSRLQQQIYGFYFSGYYNSILDIFVDHNIATLPEYSYDLAKNPNSKSEEIKKLKRRVLFKERDLSGDNKAKFRPYKFSRSSISSTQYTLFLLRGEGLPEEGMRVTEDVQEALSKSYKIKYQRQEARRGFDVPVEVEMNTKEMIDSLANPNSEAELIGNTRAKNLNGKKDTNIKYRHEYLDTTLLPTFTELLEKDMEGLLEDYDPANDEMFEKLMEILSV